MKYHLDLLKTKVELNKIDKIINQGQETFMNETRKELTNEPFSSIQTEKKGKPTPVSLANIRQTLNNKLVTLHESLKILYDSGSSHSMIKRNFVRHLKRDKTRKEENTFLTATGTFVADGKA